MGHFIQIQKSSSCQTPVCMYADACKHVASNWLMLTAKKRTFSSFKIKEIHFVSFNIPKRLDTHVHRRGQVTAYTVNWFVGPLVCLSLLIFLKRFLRLNFWLHLSYGAMNASIPLLSSDNTSKSQKSFRGL